MKTNIATLIALTVGLSALHAQSATAPVSGRQTGSAQRAKPATPLVIATLDANHDGVIDAAEMNNASVALKSALVASLGFRPFRAGALLHCAGLCRRTGRTRRSGPA